jgi:hypothetical protein
MFSDLRGLNNLNTGNHMATTPAIYSKTQLAMRIGTGSAFCNIDGVTTIGGPNFAKETIDVTHMGSTTKEYKAVPLAEAGSLTFGLQYAPTNATHSYMVSQSANQVTGNDTWKMTFSDNTAWSFTGSIENFSIKAENPSNGVLQADVSVKLTGGVNFSGT